MSTATTKPYDYAWPERAEYDAVNERIGMVEELLTPLRSGFALRLDYKYEENRAGKELPPITAEEIARLSAFLEFTKAVLRNLTDSIELLEAYRDQMASEWDKLRDDLSPR